jgi:dihydrofolate reductase
MKTLSIIAAISENNVIGLDGKLPWHLPEDMKHFREITTNSSVIMGRKTFESIGKPLKKRDNIVLTNLTNYAPEGVYIASSIQKAIDVARCKNIFFIGGEAVYRHALSFVQKLELTRVKGYYLGDMFFPEVDYSQWNLVKEINLERCSFLTYTRK